MLSVERFERGWEGTSRMKAFSPTEDDEDGKDGSAATRELELGTGVVTASERDVEEVTGIAEEVGVTLLAVEVGCWTPELWALKVTEYDNGSTLRRRHSNLSISTKRG